MIARCDFAKLTARYSQNQFYQNQTEMKQVGNLKRGKW
jgi:hypothetical protein